MAEGIYSYYIIEMTDFIFPKSLITRRKQTYLWGLLCFVITEICYLLTTKVTFIQAALFVLEVIALVVHFKAVHNVSKPTKNKELLFSSISLAVNLFMLIY